MASPAPNRLRTFLPLLAFALVALALFAHASRYWFLCDDAFISFRYARNWVDGHGLVFNPGEYVEGYSNYLWTMMVAVLWWGTGVEPDVTSLWLGSAFTMGTLALVLRLAWTSPIRSPWLVFLVTSALYASNRTVAIWTTSGLEQRMFTFWMLLAIWLFRGTTRTHRLAASFAVGLATLTRPDGLYMGPMLLAWATWELRAASPDWKRHVPFIWGPAGVLVGTHLVWRIATYGALLPNTFQAKGYVWWSAGGLYVLGAIIEYSLWMTLPFAAYGAWLRYKEGDRLHVFGAGLVAVQMLLLARVGGDHFEYRMLDLAFVFWSIAVAEGVVGSVRYVRSSRQVPLLFAVSTILVFYQNVLGVLDWRANHDTEKTSKHHLPVEASLAPYAYYAPMVPVMGWAYNEAREWGAPGFIATRHIYHNNFMLRQTERWGPMSADHRKPFPDGLMMVHGSMGVMPYHLSDVGFTDMLGLTDSFVAHAPLRKKTGWALAHFTHEVGDYFEQRRTVTFLQNVRTTHQQALKRAHHAVHIGPNRWIALYGEIERFEGFRKASRTRLGPGIETYLRGRLVERVEPIEGNNGELEWVERKKADRPDRIQTKPIVVGKWRGLAVRVGKPLKGAGIRLRGLRGKPLSKKVTWKPGQTELLFPPTRESSVVIEWIPGDDKSAKPSVLSNARRLIMEPRKDKR